MNPTDLDLIERFISAFNAIDFHLQALLGESERASFRGLVDVYAKRHRWWRDAETLRVFASLRNVIVHDKVVPYENVCVPTRQTVEAIEAIRDRLLHPERAGKKFAREVVALHGTDTLLTVLRLMHNRGITHFPVYCGERFCGVLSTNGVALFLAAQAVAGIQLVDFAEVKVDDMLNREERRENYFFVPQGEPVQKIAHDFHENTFLEAVLITPHGAEHEKLLGIATRADVLEFGS